MVSSSPLDLAQSPLAEQDHIDLLHELVAIPSLSGSEQAAVIYLRDAMLARGFDAWIDAAGSAVGKIGSGARHIVLLGHIDTVPGDIPVRIEDGILHGRGAVDAKGPLATFVAAAALAADRLNARVTVVGATGEESIGSPGANEAANWPAPDLCIIGEPSGWDAICLGYRGTWSFTWRKVQPCRHSAGPGESAAEQAFGFWQELLVEVNQRNNEATGFNAIGPALRGFWSKSDGLHEQAELSIGLRLPPDLEVDDLVSKVTQLAGNAEIEVHGLQHGYQSGKQSALIPPFLRSIRAEGGAPRFTKKLGTSDMSIVGPAWRCPIVAYGPGDAALDHTPEERIVLDEYLKAVRILTEVLVAL